MAVIAVPQVLGATGSTVTVASFVSDAFGSSVGTGSTVLAFIWFYTAGVTLSVDDSTGSNTAKWTQDAVRVYSGGSNLQCAVWRASNVVGGSSFTLTVTPSANAYISVCALEATGLANVSPLDGAGSTNEGASAAGTTGAFTTTNADDLLVATFASTSMSLIGSRPSGFTQVGSLTDSGTRIDGDASYQIVSSTQTSVDRTWITTSSGNWASIGLAYQLSTAAGPVQNLGTTCRAVHDRGGHRELQTPVVGGWV